MSKIKKNSTRIVVTSSSFCKNPYLRECLEKCFDNVVFNPSENQLSEKEVIGKLLDVEAAIIGLDPITKNVLKACPNLKIVSKYGVGLDNIDQNACKEFNIELGWTGGVNKRSVSEMTLCFMLGLARNLYRSSILLKNGKWKKDGGAQLSEKTVGIIGVGNIGKDLIELLKPFNCKILVNDIIDQKQYYVENGVFESSKEEIFKTADFITIHTPLTSETYRMVDRKSLSLMKPTAFIINTARGSIVDEFDLQNALEHKIIAGAAIDVYEEEPILNKKLVDLPNFFCTPHIGGNSFEAVKAMGESAVMHLKNYFLIPESV